MLVPGLRRAELTGVAPPATLPGHEYHTPDTVDEIRQGRNWIRKGDTVRVLPSKPGKRDGFLATFHYAASDGTYAEVFGGPAGRCPATRTLPLDRIARVVQTRSGQRLDRVR